jgi:diguanylate cyclase (GGDEF)-like protein/PAS domain S-box-containing protein
MVWWFFITPTHTLAKTNPRAYFPLVTFVLMGAMFTLVQERLREAHARSARALVGVEQANRSLEEAKHHAETLLEKTLETDKLKSQFFANVSHELRTPLALILGPTQSLLASPETTETQQHQLELVDRQAHHLLRLVNELLEGSRLESGRAVPRYTGVDLVRLVRGVCSQFELAAADRGIAYTVVTADTLPMEVDAERVQRALTNLVSNALKFTPPGGAVRVELRRTTDTAVIEVADSGPGIPVEFRETVFERFRQVEGDSARPYGGTGLGLAIARDIAELQGGSLTLDSAPEGGALLTLTLPLRASPDGVEEVALDADINAAVAELRVRTHTPADVARIGAEASRPTHRILVIEDNPDLALFIKDSLGEGYHVEVAGDGRAGLRSARARRPDLIICDVMMPSMTGEQVVLAVRGELDLIGVPIVILTARADDDTRLSLLRAGANDFLTKPFDIAELRARVDNLLRLRTTETRLSDALARAEGLLHASPHATVVVDATGSIVLVNRQASTMFGYHPNELVGQKVETLLPESAREAHPTLRASFARHPHARAMGSGLDLVARHADGSLIPVDVSLSPVDTTEGPLVIAAVRDISDQRRVHEKLAHLAMHDPLTGLPNRSLFLDRLAHAVADAGRNGTSVAVFFIDVDRFKHVNDTHGHDIGDQYLTSIAQRLTATVRPHDTVGRLGGDEFAIIGTDLPSEQDAALLAGRVLAGVRAPLVLGGTTFHPTVSVGVATTSGYDAAPDELMGAADMAMYRAKTRGRDRVEVFDETLRVLADTEFTTISAIRRALDNDGLRLLYQPIVDLATSRVVRVEALVRIEDPDRGLLSPADFLGVAEETGLIVPIGAWVVQEATRTLARWQRAGVRHDIAINLSSRQLNDPDIETIVLDAAHAAGADLHGLCIEVTETVFMDATPNLLSRIDRLKQAGVLFAVDDFGTGWSNLVYLKDLPVDEIKIDRVFTQGVGTRPRDTAIVTAIVQLARALGMRTTIEGVETLQQAASVQDLKCDYAQGYLYGRPMPASEVEVITSITRSAG